MSPTEQVVFDRLMTWKDAGTPVVLHSPYNPNNFRVRQVGILREVVDTSHLEKRTHSEPMAWIQFPDGVMSPAWAGEFREARLRNPLVFRSTFQATNSKIYCGDDQRYMRRKNQIDIQSIEEEAF